MKTLRETVEVLRALVEAKTFAQAKAEIMDGLKKDGWTIKTLGIHGPLKVPHATSPDGKHKLWFKPQAIYLSRGDEDLGAARTLTYDDIRKFDYSAFGRVFAMTTGELPSGEKPKPAGGEKPKPALGATMGTDKSASPSGPAPSAELTPDQYHFKFGKCPDGYHFDDRTKRCLKVESRASKLVRELRDQMKTL